MLTTQHNIVHNTKFTVWNNILTRIAMRQIGIVFLLKDGKAPLGQSPVWNAKIGGIKNV